MLATLDLPTTAQFDEVMDTVLSGLTDMVEEAQVGLLAVSPFPAFVCVHSVSAA